MRLASRLGGRRVMFSGAGVMEKGDIRVEHVPHTLFHEVKYCGTVRARDGAHTYSLAYEDIEKTILDAEAARCIPVFSICYAGHEHEVHMTLKKYWDEIVSQLHDYYELLQELNQPKFAVPLKPNPRVVRELHKAHQEAMRRRLHHPPNPTDYADEVVEPQE